MKSKKKQKTILIAVICLLVLAVCVCLGVFFYQKLMERRRSVDIPEDMQSSQTTDDTVVYNGEEYKYNDQLMNILFMGVDKRDEFEEHANPSTGGQADCVMILSLNKETKEANILQISRDSMTDVDIYDTNGNYYTTVFEQLADQYSYGNGMETSCWAMKKTVGELLFGLPIDGYLALNLEGISTMNNAVGGVTITVPEDYTAIDPAFAKGATLTLTGEQAERYVRYRDTTEFASNNGRMQRQVQYIPALIAKIREMVGSSGGDYYDAFYPIMSSYMITDLTADQMNEMADYHLQTDHVRYVPGNIQLGQGRDGKVHEQYYVDDEGLRIMLLDMFYKKI